MTTFRFDQQQLPLDHSTAPAISDPTAQPFRYSNSDPVYRTANAYDSYDAGNTRPAYHVFDMQYSNENLKDLQRQRERDEYRIKMAYAAQQQQINQQPFIPQQPPPPPPPQQ